MSQTSIEWTATPRPDGSMAPGYTFNPWWGCTKVSPGCVHCYAESFAKRVGQKVWGVDVERRFFGDKHWNEPLLWNASASTWPERRKVFCASMADVFEDGRGLGSQRARLFELIEKTKCLDWLLLTKRPQNVRQMVPVRWLDAWPANVWLGTTCEDQARANERIPLLLETPAAVRFISAEPLLGPIDLRAVPYQDGNALFVGPMGGREWAGAARQLLGWCIVGGESGAGARPCRVEWIRSLVQQCVDAAVPCFVKQLGAKPFTDQEASHWPKGWGPNVECILGRPAPAHETYGLKSAKGGDPDEWPEYLRIREFPREGVLRG